MREERKEKERKKEWSSKNRLPVRPAVCLSGFLPIPVYVLGVEDGRKGHYGQILEICPHVQIL